MPPVNHALDGWTRRGLSFAATLILIGSALPLLKHSVLLGSSVWIWPWTLMNPGSTAESAAATATWSTGQNYAAFLWLPIIAGFLAVFLAYSRPLIFRSAGSFLLGGGFLVVMLARLTAENEIYGLSFVPPTAAGGILTTVVVLALAVVATANRLRKRASGVKSLRIASGLAGAFLVLAFSLALLGGQDAWTGWSVRLVCASAIAYGAVAVRAALARHPSPQLLGASSLLIRAIAIAAPVACLIAQLGVDDPFTNMVVAGGGGFANVFFSILRSWAIYSGGALLLAHGLAGWASQIVAAPIRRTTKGPVLA
jgi:hypothetical protein